MPRGRTNAAHCATPAHGCRSMNNNASRRAALPRWNRRTWLMALGATLGLPLAPTAYAAASLRVPPLRFTQRKLANRLTVITMPDRSSATVTVHVWYRVGGKDDPVGRSGFAHLFEHMMFKGTAHLKAE